MLGTMHFHQGTLDQAIESYKKALVQDPDYMLCSYDLGVAYFHRGNMPESIRAFRRCLELDAHYNAAHYRLAIALFHAGELEQALEHFEKCTALTPEFLMARYHIGVIYERMGNRHRRSQQLLSPGTDSPGRRRRGGGRSAPRARQGVWPHQRFLKDLS
jgi:tetratricopeptide (TPR) repeat protein